MTEKPAPVIRLAPPPRARASPEAIAMLRDMITRVERGELVAVAVAASGLDGSLHTGWDGMPGELIASIQVLSSRLMQEFRRE